MTAASARSAWRSTPPRARPRGPGGLDLPGHLGASLDRSPRPARAHPRGRRRAEPPRRCPRRGRCSARPPRFSRGGMLRHVPRPPRCCSAPSCSAGLHHHTGHAACSARAACASARSPRSQPCSRAPQRQRRPPRRPAMRLHGAHDLAGRSVRLRRQRPLHPAERFLGPGDPPLDAGHRLGGADSLGGGRRLGLRARARARPRPPPDASDLAEWLRAASALLRARGQPLDRGDRLGRELGASALADGPREPVRRSRPAALQAPHGGPRSAPAPRRRARARRPQPAEAPRAGHAIGQLAGELAMFLDPLARERLELRAHGPSSAARRSSSAGAVATADYRQVLEPPPRSTRFLSVGRLQLRRVSARCGLCGSSTPASKSGKPVAQLLEPVPGLAYAGPARGRVSRHRSRTCVSAVPSASPSPGARAPGPARPGAAHARVCRGGRIQPAAVLARGPVLRQLGLDRVDLLAGGAQLGEGRASPRAARSDAPAPAGSGGARARAARPARVSPRGPRACAPALLLGLRAHLVEHPPGPPARRRAR